MLARPLPHLRVQMLPFVAYRCRERCPSLFGFYGNASSGTLYPQLPSA